MVVSVRRWRACDSLPPSDQTPWGRCCLLLPQTGHHGGGAACFCLRPDTMGVLLPAFASDQIPSGRCWGPTPMPHPIHGSAKWAANWRPHSSAPAHGTSSLCMELQRVQGRPLRGSLWSAHGTSSMEFHGLPLPETERSRPQALFQSMLGAPQAVGQAALVRSPCPGRNWGFVSLWDIAKCVTQ